MIDDLRGQIYLNFRQHETEDLLAIWRTHDCYEWSETTFDVIREILQERHVEVPPQGLPVYAEHKLGPAAVRQVQKESQTAQKKEPRPQNRRAPTGHSRLSPDRWVKHYRFRTVAVSFVVSVLASWFVCNLVLWLQEPEYPFDLFPNMMYAMLCLPVQAIVLVLGAAMGAVSTQSPAERWRRATYGVWIVGLMAIVAAVVAAGTLPRSGT
jgi:hypothetical protein